MDCTGVVDIMVLGGAFVMEVVEEVELVVGCVMRLVLWCANGRGYFLCCFSLMSVEINGLSVGGYLFGMTIWEGCFLLLEHNFLGRMVGTEVVMEVVVEVVVVEAVDVVRAGYFCFFQAWLLGGYDGCERGNGGCGWCGGVGDVTVGGVGARGEGVVSSGGSVSVTDGEGARSKDFWKALERPPIPSPIDAQYRRYLFVG